MYSEAINQFVNSKKLGIFLDEAIYNVVIDALCKMSKLDDAKRLFDEMKHRKLMPDIVHYTTLINGHCLNGNIFDAVRLFEEMNKSWLRADIVNYNVLAGGLSRMGLLDEVCSLLKAMNEQGLTPSRVMLSTDDGPNKSMCINIIAALCRARDMETARWAFDQMVGKGLTPDAVIYTIIMNGYCRANRLQEAFDLLSDMKARGMNPDIITYTEASTLLCDVKDMGLKPDVICYTALIDSHCKSGNLQDAASLFNQLIGQGLPLHTLPSFLVIASREIWARFIRKYSDSHSVNASRIFIPKPWYWDNSRSGNIIPGIQLLILSDILASLCLRSNVFRIYLLDLIRGDCANLSSVASASNISRGVESCFNATFDEFGSKKRRRAYSSFSFA
ncbi:hypothetical protein SASPL_149545 [Salvia splendens]|uniref:Pentatricopeptide repeat-containing protein n=1 Tax=Salvia splendens TaxID=180675 RepID=A0A8X8WB07_SALSN|nr:hypothetical protein SASPL_149545 [Salvia splendens]